MDLLENRTNHPNIIKSAAADSCVFESQTYHHSIIIPFNGEVMACDLISVDELNQQIVQQLCDYHPEVIILATGSSIIFPTTELLDPLVKLNIGLEVLHNEAAARTFNILLAEDRKVVCLMLLADNNCV
ncbi:Mth938-like domain-containing protein [Marinicella litoralis]|uniref:Uncharacterized protein DUF498/DUF598 n=1 Tax=Marinicella litoralis TaxID=644220 RepID=A0A4R6XWN0_9GAMM|nr:MTH938/NDUFAF3 family protein [Marinicella litoralis]TDR22654.1 uncharacterized protein DUF498/DUF598 [Marinicella litoralis]